MSHRPPNYQGAGSTAMRYLAINLFSQLLSVIHATVEKPGDCARLALPPSIKRMAEKTGGWGGFSQKIRLPRRGRRQPRQENKGDVKKKYRETWKLEGKK